MPNELFDNLLSAEEVAEIERHLDEVQRAKDKKKFLVSVAETLERAAINSIRKMSGASQSDLHKFMAYRQVGLKEGDTGLAAKAYHAYRRELENIISAADDLTGNHGSHLHSQVLSGIRGIWTSISGR